MPFKVDLDPAHRPNRAQNGCRDVRPNRIVEIYDYPVMKPCTHAFLPNLVGTAPWPMRATKRSNGRLRGRFPPRTYRAAAANADTSGLGNEEAARRPARPPPTRLTCGAGPFTSEPWAGPDPSGRRSGLWPSPCEDLEHHRLSRCDPARRNGSHRAHQRRVRDNRVENEEADHGRDNARDRERSSHHR